MKLELKLHLMGILVLIFCVSCGQTVKETIKPVVPTPATGQLTRVVIIPFADHTPSSSLYSHCRRNILVTEALQDALYRTGFVPAAQEDVVQYLLDQGIIQDVYGDASSAKLASLQQELQEDWSDEMKDEIRNVMYHNISTDNSWGDQKSVALNCQMLNDLGSTFCADYVIRGRIVEFDSDQKDSFNPIRTGLIPFVFKSGQRTIFGVAESEGYEKIDMDAIERYDRLRALFWGAGAFVTGLIGEKQGRVRGATVQIRVLAQDPNTGDVLWLNRAEACSIPSSAFAGQEIDDLLAKSIEQAVNSLIDDFADAVVSGRVARTCEKAPVVTTEETPEGAKAEDFAAELAADRAERSALEAKEYAGQAEDAAAQATRAAVESKDAVKRASEASKKSEKIFEKIIAK